MRRRLLDAATDLYSRRGFGEVGMREVAREAGVSPAMISYYFGDKLGLYEAMFDSVFDRLLAGIRELSASPQPDAHPIASFVRLYVELLGRDPWVPQFLAREVLSSDTPLRQRFIERFASRVAELLPGLFSHLQHERVLREELDPKLLTMSLVGMCVFPFLTYPVLGPALGFELDESFREHLIEHTTGVFLEGAARQRSSR